jgi:tricorn protease
MTTTSGYLRRPTIADDTIVFVSEDDLWSVPAGGGVARRLTATPSEITTAALSRDGRLLAFTSLDEHHPEVWCMPAGGGQAERLTWLGANTSVRGFTPDGRVVFVSDAAAPMRGRQFAYTVASTGGPVERLPFGPALEVAFGPNGALAIGRNTADPARWKRYRGGTAGEIWVDARGNGSFRRLPQPDSNIGSPMWLRDRIWFLSDHEGIGNLYSCRPNGGDLRRHTDHGEYYARFAATDGTRIVYQHAADIWLYDPARESSERVDIALASPRVQRSRKFVDAAGYLMGYAAHPAGHSIAVETRGKLFTMPLWEEAPRPQGRPDGVRYRHSRWLGDGSALVTISDEDGEDAIEVYRDGDVRRLAGLDLGCVTELATPPRGHLVALANHRHELLLVDLDASTLRRLDASEQGGLDGVEWSPDSRWLVYSAAVTRRSREIRVCEIARRTITAVTSGDFSDFHPSFDPRGKYLYFLSHRTFDPVYDELSFDLGFPKSVRPYAITLQASEPSPFVPKPRGLGGDDKKSASGDDEKKDDTKKDGKKSAGDDKKDGVAPVVIDLDGIRERIVAVPVPEGRYSQVVGISEKILLAAWPVHGSRDLDFLSGDVPAGATLEVYDLAEHKHDTLVSGITSFEVSRDGHTLVYRAGSRLRALKAGEKPPENTEHEGPGRSSGWIDLERVRVSVDPGLEWRQMFREAWRLQRDHFWVADMSGVDWNVVLNRYLPLVDKVATRREFSDLMWEMQGELGTSHAYEFGGDLRPPPPGAIGHLGADLEYDTRARLWRITHVTVGDPWDAHATSPLRGPGIAVGPGDTLLAVNGRAADDRVTPASLLVHQAGVPVELTIGDRRGRNPRRVVVTTLRDEKPARYREWVEANRRRVHEATAGRVGYVHVPDMGPEGFAEFHRLYLVEFHRDALIVDVRNNGGGHVSPLVLEKLARRRLGYGVARWEPHEPYPDESPAGPLVALTDELAGSDGDIFTHCFKLLGLGPVVGKRTWGGVVGVSIRHQLVDGSVTTQPECAYWFVDVGWRIENYGTDPDVEVDITPQDWAAGRDPQLDRSIELAQRALRRHHALAADVAARPQLPLPVLPPRDAPSNGRTGRAATRATPRPRKR